MQPQIKTAGWINKIYPVLFSFEHVTISLYSINFPAGQRDR